LDPVEDDSGARTGSNIGNIHVALPATDGGGTPIFLNAHLDTVPPDGAVEPEIRNGIVVNRRDTILGADNKAAVAVMLEAFARLASGAPHAGVELVLTPMEEVGLQGAKAFDTSRIVSEYEGYRFARTHEAVRLVSQALDGCGYPVTYIESGGGADANVFNAAGVPCVNVCNGMAEIHTASEHISVADLEGMLGVTMGLIEAARVSGSTIAQPDHDGGVE